jgi:hypothetical protein
MSTNDDVRDEVHGRTEDAPQHQTIHPQPSVANNDDDDFVDPRPAVRCQDQATSKGGDKGKERAKTPKRKAATVAAKKISEGSAKKKKRKVKVKVSNSVLAFTSLCDGFSSISWFHKNS